MPKMFLTPHQLRLRLLSPGPPKIPIFKFFKTSETKEKINHNSESTQDPTSWPTLAGLASLGVSAAAAAAEGASADASVSIGSTAAEAEMKEEQINLKTNL